jgi:hypothetical protein
MGRPMARTNSVDSLLARLASAWSAKRDGRWRYETLDGLFHHDGGDALVYGVHPNKVMAFGKGPFTHTTHRFSRR